MARASNETLTVVNLGDSIATGLGVGGRSYATYLTEQLAERTGRSTQLVDLSIKAGIVSDSLPALPAVASELPDLILVKHGTVEGIGRLRPGVLRWLPRRWRPIGLLDPRPYFSTRWWRRLPQRAESWFRWHLKAVLMMLFGSETVLAAPVFEQELGELVGRLLDDTRAKVVLVTESGLDLHLFAGSETPTRSCYEATLRVASTFGQPDRLLVADVSRLLHRWDDFLGDHLHPNEDGHRKIAAAIFKALSEAPLPALGGDVDQPE